MRLCTFLSIYSGKNRVLILDDGIKDGKTPIQEKTDLIQL